MRCSSPTKAGPRCRRQATKGEKLCASHLGLVGRKTKLDDTVTARIVTAIQAGNYQDAAARHAGIHPATFYDWMARGEAGEAQYAEFHDAVKKAAADAEVHAVAVVRQAMNDSWQAMTFLERRHPERWGRRQVLEHSGRGGGPIEHTVDPGDPEVRELGHALLAKLAAAEADEDDAGAES